MKSPISIKLAGFAAALAAASFACFSAAPAFATPIDYYLSPYGTAATTLDSVTYTITASFAFDSATDLESLVDIMLSGSGSFAGTYLSDPTIIGSVHTQVPDNQDVCGWDGSVALCLRFTDALGGLSDDPLEIIATGTDEANLDLPATAVDGSPTGTAIPGSPLTAVPEPSSIGLWASALAVMGLFLFRRRAAKA